MKIILLISILLLFFGCVNSNSVAKKPPLVNLVVQQDKYSLIFKHQFYNNFETFDKSLAKFIVETNLSFNTSNALSDNGNNTLKIIKGTVNYKILNKINSNSSNLDKQLSNFLSSQLNTQSTLINLTEALSKNGILEAKKVKEYFQNIEKELKKIKK